MLEIVGVLFGVLFSKPGCQRHHALGILDDPG